MSAPDRIWIDAWGGNWSPRGDGTQSVEYLLASLLPAMLAEAEERGRKAEREACAQVCEESGAWNNTAQAIAAAIRARGEE